MIPLPRDFREFIQLLNEHRVRYLVIGGYAVGYHGYPRYTGDLDVFVELSIINTPAVAKVLRQFGLLGKDATYEPLVKRGTIVRMGREPMRLEVINDIDGVTFAECYKHRVVARTKNLRINFIDLARLRRNKQASGRPKDLEDLRRLPETAPRKRTKPRGQG
jgi:hypothetical protein